MICETINRTSDGRVRLRTYVQENWREPADPLRPAIIVLPGGAFTYYSPKESEPVALTFAGLGYHTFLLDYSLGEESAWPAPLLDVAWAIRTVREHAEEWALDPARVCVLGFSAGATVAALAATQWDNPLVGEALGCTPEEVRPDAAAICYGPARAATCLGADGQGAEELEFGRIMHEGRPEVDYVDFLDERTPPLFLWHTSPDEVVPVQNSLIASQRLADLGIPFELHVFRRGAHGYYTSDLSARGGVYLDPSIRQWVSLFDAWFRQLDVPATQDPA